MTTSYSANGLRTVDFITTLDASLGQLVTALVLRLRNPGDAVVYIPFTLEDASVITVPFGLGEQEAFMKASKDVSGSSLAIDFVMSSLPLCLTFSADALATFFESVSEAIIQGTQPSPVEVTMSLTYLAEAYRDGDLGNAFGDPISGMDD